MYNDDGSYRFVDFSKVKSAEEAKQEELANRPKVEKTPEQELQEAVVNLRSYMDVSSRSPLSKSMNSVGGVDYVEEQYKQKVYDAYNKYKEWKTAQDTPTTTDTDTTVKEEVKTTTPVKTAAATSADTVEYTYKPGDTFGQVIKNLGLESGSGLWGNNGDVAYYTQQLAEQGAMNSAGNIPIGTTIRLTRRPTDPALQEYYKKYGYKG